MPKRRKQVTGAIVETQTVRTREVQPDPNDPRTQIQKLFPSGPHPVSLETYLERLFTLPQIDRVAVFKVKGRHAALIDFTLNRDSELGRVAEDVEGKHGAGQYNFAGVYRGSYVSSKFVLLGGEAALDDLQQGRGGEGEDIDGALAKQVSRMSAITTIREMRKMNREDEPAKPLEGGEEMKIGDLIAFATALKPDAPPPPKDDPFLKELLVQMRAENLELRKAVMEMAGGGKKDIITQFFDLIKSKGSPALVERMVAGKVGEIAPDTSWTPQDWMSMIHTALEALKEGLPTILQAVQSQTSNIGRVVVPGQRVPAEPVQPTNGKETVMPIQLPEEAKEALSMILGWIREKNYVSAWECLKATPPLGMLAVQLNPEADARAYLPLMKAFVGGVVSVEMQQDILTFLQWAQKRVIEESEPELDGNPA